MFTIQEKTNPIQNVGAITAMIYGEAGVGKTTLASASSNSVLLDFNKGDTRTCTVANTLKFDTYKDIANHEDKFYEALNKYDVAIIDTVDSFVDVMQEYFLSIDPACRDNRIAYGKYINPTFRKMINKLHQMGKDVILVAHMVDKGLDETGGKRYYPELSGKNAAFAIGETSLIGMMRKKGNEETVLYLQNNGDYISKSPHGMKNINIPQDMFQADPFYFDTVISNTKKQLKEQKNIHFQTAVFVDNWKIKINGMNADEANNILQEIQAIEEKPLSVMLHIKKIFKNGCKSLGMIYDKDSGQFINKKSGEIPIQKPEPKPAKPVEKTPEPENKVTQTLKEQFNIQPVGKPVTEEEDNDFPIDF